MEQTSEFFVSMLARPDYFGAATFLRLFSGEAIGLARPDIWIQAGHRSGV
jgi:hypothetical protein